MADSIHDQWPAATGEWSRVTAQFLAAWVNIYADYNVNSAYAAFAAGIGYLSRMHEDSTVMAGDMITHIVQTGADNDRGLIQNFQNLQRHVLPRWGELSAEFSQRMAIHYALNAEKYALDRVGEEAVQRGSADAHEALLRAAAVTAEARARTEAVNHTREQTAAAFAVEAAARAAGDQHSRQQAAAGDKAVSDRLTKQIADVLKYAQSIPGTIDARAAGGYDPTLRERAGLLGKLLDTAAAHDPLVAGLVSNLAKFIIDLAGVEDPVLKIAAQLVLKQVIDRLGVDTALQAMLSDLVGGILGGGQPKTLTTIMGDIGGRLDALERGQAELSPLAPEADNLHEMGTLIFDASLLAYLAAAVAAPVATADDTVTVFEAVAHPLLAPVRAMLGMPS